MFESRAGVFLIAGLGFFILAFLVMALVPILMFYHLPEQTPRQLAEEGILHEFVELAERYPDRFKAHFGTVSYDSMTEALTLGHQVYVAEACWHCHSQQVRPVSNESRRWGDESYATEYQNALQRPVLFGTRRVGPDLIREGARKSNDWHIAHFWRPTSVVPVSVMPEYRWFFDDEGYLNKKGMAIVTYIQWLGSWSEKYPYWHGEGPSPTRMPQPDAGDEQPIAGAPADGGEGAS